MRKKLATLMLAEAMAACGGTEESTDTQTEVQSMSDMLSDETDKQTINLQ